ncbi:MAG TPA: helix-turn-helix domain-containing protein [bacterium]|nr:helix-turn-helix domain-containing protein [bacterium]
MPHPPQYDARGVRLVEVVVDVEAYNGDEPVYANYDDDTGAILYNYILLPEDQPPPKMKRKRQYAPTPVENPHGTNLLTVQEAADRLRVCVKTIRRRIKDGSIRYVSIGRKQLIDKTDLETFVALSKHADASAPSATGRGRPKKPFNSKRALKNIGIDKKGRN